jgi:D-alanyl-D-alanine carboxypeptidase-like protein
MGCIQHSRLGVYSSMRPFLLGCAVVAMAASGCGGSPPAAAPDGPGAVTTSPASSNPSPSPTAPATTPPTKPQAPTFTGSSSPIDEATRSRMRYSWRPGCPVQPADLRLLRLSHWRFDGTVGNGEIVVHRDFTDGVLGVFRKLFEARFAIERMELVDVYEGDDDRSMAANNTSGFNCRRSTGDAGSWSEHAFGRAIDINPVQNPYVPQSGDVEPPAGAGYRDRRAAAPGKIRSGDAVVRAFAGIGWSWGGDWSSAKDYQHFSSTGR